MRKLKRKLREFIWVKVLFSPFKPFKVGLYVGKTQIGVPYFLPRKWVKYNEQDIQEAIAKHKANKNYVQHLDSKLYDMYKGYTKSVPLTVGFSYCSLGWKTKWSHDDYRFEWNPVFSFVCFGYQIALTAYHKHNDQYWTSWLYYENETDKTKDIAHRIKQCREKFPQVWVSSTEGRIDYYERILKTKYLK